VQVSYTVRLDCVANLTSSNIIPTCQYHEAHLIKVQVSIIECGRAHRFYLALRRSCGRRR
jgi:hypothetical protein